MCRDSIINVVRGSPGYTNNTQIRLFFIDCSTDDPNPTPQIIDALTDATQDNSKQIRDSAIAALDKIGANSQSE